MSFEQDLSPEAAERLSEAARRYIQAGIEEAMRRKKRAAEAAWWSEEPFPDEAAMTFGNLNWFAWAARSI